jgi:hypothetical protein
VKRRKRKKAARELKKSLDRFSEKKRGRPPKIPTNWVVGRAYNYRMQLGQMWEALEGPLLKARTAEEVTATFREHGKQNADQIVPAWSPDILAVILDPKFPKRSEARVNFLADSLGGRPSVSFRTSRDICEKERAKQRQKSPHHIIRKEYYVECSCGYKGPARNDACRKCGAEIPPSIEELMGAKLSFDVS